MRDCKKVEETYREGAHMSRSDLMRLIRITRDTEGQDLAEYAILISLIALVCIAAITLIGNRLAAMFTALAAAF